GADAGACRWLDGRRARHRLGGRAVAASGNAARQRSSAGARAATRPADGSSLMSLGTLLHGLGAGPVEGNPYLDVPRDATDSRRAQRGDVLCALAGQATDGRRHVAEGLARGARAVVADGDLEVAGATRVRCSDPRRLLGPVAARLTGDPGAHLVLVGVTGTNGKTTTTNLLEGICRPAGPRPRGVRTTAQR